MTKNTKLKTFRDLVVTPMNCSVFIPHVQFDLVYRLCLIMSFGSGVSCLLLNLPALFSHSLSCVPLSGLLSPYVYNLPVLNLPSCGFIKKLFPLTIFFVRSFH